MVTQKTEGIICHLFFTEKDETGVMDSLLEALQSGAAFRNRRKQVPRFKGKYFFFSLSSFLTLSLTFYRIMPQA